MYTPNTGALAILEIDDEQLFEQPKKMSPRQLFQYSQDGSNENESEGASSYFGKAVLTLKLFYKALLLGREVLADLAPS